MKPGSNVLFCAGHIAIQDTGGSCQASSGLASPNHRLREKDGTGKREPVKYPSTITRHQKYQAMISYVAMCG